MNTTSKDGFQFGQFNQQIDVALPTRLIRQGFPFIELREQSRMVSSLLAASALFVIELTRFQHPVLSRFPNEVFYSGTLRDSARVETPMSPALKGVLDGIIAKSFTEAPARQVYLDTALESQARNHWIQVKGKREPLREGQTSVCVKEHVDVFFDHIFPDLQEHFGEETSKNLMIICAYGAAVSR